MTNSSALQKQIDENEHLLRSDQGPGDGVGESYTKLTLGTTQQAHAGETKVLGVRWNPSMDCLVFDLSDVVSHVTDLEPTKRHVIGVASRFYDPVGFVSPVTIRFEMMFQECVCGKPSNPTGALVQVAIPCVQPATS